MKAAHHARQSKVDSSSEKIALSSSVVIVHSQCRSAAQQANMVVLRGRGPAFVAGLRVVSASSAS